MEIESKKLDITPEMVILSRNILRQYTGQVGKFDCHKCILYKECEKDLRCCPETWEDIGIEED